MEQLERATLTPEAHFKILFTDAPLAKASLIAKTKGKGREMNSTHGGGREGILLGN